MADPSLLNGDNAAFLDAQYRAWVTDPSSVEPVWRDLFEEMQDEPVNGARFVPPSPDRRSIFAAEGGTALLAGDIDAETARRQSGIVQFINAWRVRGHFQAEIDPLKRAIKRDHPEITLEHYGLTEADLDAHVDASTLDGVPDRSTIRQIRDHLTEAYSGTIAAEFMNIDDLEQKRWVIQQLEELPHREVLGRDAELRVLRKLADAESFERMLHVKFPGTKRFSLEGGETLIPLLDLLLDESGKRGVREIVIGMAHRGRLNVLANTLEKPAHLIVREFEDSRGPVGGSGDVKYHLGYSGDVVTASGQPMHLSLTPNPSHLEAVNAVVEGRVRAKQDRVGDPEARKLAMPLLLHGDAAFIGQGSVMENLQLSELSGYATGGTVHIVINNQIGFTTGPNEGRSTPYSTDAARMMAIPIFHVNGEDPRAVAAAVQIAVAWRQTFHRDVVIDMYCYRKHGHNEGDEPSFTQPLMYEQIRKRNTPREAYQNALLDKGHLQDSDLDGVVDTSRSDMDDEASRPEVEAVPVERPDVPEQKDEDPDTALYDEVDSQGETNPAVVQPETVSPLKGRWEALTDGRIDEEVHTAVAREELVPLLERLVTLPEDFKPHNKVKRLLKQRGEMAAGDRPFDWAMAESAAFASLVAEGHPVRLAGQDSARGTFSQRHAVYTDVRTGEEVFPLQRVSDDQARFQVIDSPLSEYAALGFEYGYSLDTPDGLVGWEAQFGDFSNGAQVVIDQFISSSEQKWGRLSGLVMMLPHAYEGQGPEHSSARLERFLMMCAQDNIQVANFSTPANFFHALRRQVVRHVRKPLVVMTPKSLLRHPRCTSTLDQLTEGAFRRVIADPREDLEASALERVVFCTGHVYYDLLPALEELPEAERAKVAVHRIELLYPFPASDLRVLLDDAPDGVEIVWCQEEPRNMGAWPVLAHWFHDMLPPGRHVRYVGRPPAASPATGSHSQHKREQDALVAESLDLGS